MAKSLETSLKSCSSVIIMLLFTKKNMLVAVARLRVGWLNVRSSVLLDLYLRFCILDVFLMYFSCACVLLYMA